MNKKSQNDQICFLFISLNLTMLAKSLNVVDLLPEMPTSSKANDLSVSPINVNCVDAVTYRRPYVNGFTDLNLVSREQVLRRRD